MTALTWLSARLGRHGEAHAARPDRPARPIPWLTGDATLAVAGSQSDVILFFDSSSRSAAGARTAERLGRAAGQRALPVFRVDADEHPEAARRLGVGAVPALIRLSRGQLCSMRLGELSDDDLLAWLDDQSSIC